MSYFFRYESNQLIKRSLDTSCAEITTGQTEPCGFLDRYFLLVLSTSVQILHKTLKNVLAFFYLFKIFNEGTVQDSSINLVWLVAFGALGKTQITVSSQEAATCLSQGVLMERLV